MVSVAEEYPLVAATEIVTVQFPPLRKLITASVRLDLPDTIRCEIEHTSLVADENDKLPELCATEIVWVTITEP